MEISDRPLIEKLFENETYFNQYHEYLEKLTNEYLQENNIKSTIEALKDKISTHVRNDAQAFCTYEEYEEATKALTNVLILRGESIRGQLDGTIPSTTTGQEETPEKLIEGNEEDLQRLMGDMGKGQMKPGEGNRVEGNKGEVGSKEEIDNKQFDKNRAPMSQQMRPGAEMKKQVNMMPILNIVVLGIAGIWIKRIGKKRRI